MAERREGGEGGGTDPWIWIFVVVVIVALLSSGGDSGFSFFGGGSDIRFGSPSQQGTVEEELREVPPSFINPPAPTPPSSSQSTGTISTPTENQLSVQAFGNARLPYETEYVQISAYGLNRGKVILTGMVLKNKNNESVVIGPDENGRPITLAPGERALVSTGPSPRGINFKINKCSGYLAQGQNYYPGISNSCPIATTLPQVRDLSENCERFLERSFACQTPNINFESGIDNKCAAFIGEHLNYVGCVKDFKNDSDFDKGEWRVYLGRTREFWANLHEDVYLYSQSGILITKVSY